MINYRFFNTQYAYVNELVNFISKDEAMKLKNRNSVVYVVLFGRNKCEAANDAECMVAA